MNSKKGKFIQVLALVTLGFSCSAYAGDHPISEPKIFQGKLETALVWIPPVTMAPKTTSNGKKPDIHNEVDQHAIKGNDMGFAAGEWIPNSQIACTISKENSDWVIVFPMMWMVADDGPHYGRNVALDGPGKYHEQCRIYPPDNTGFFRHTDKESGVGPWFKPYTIKGSFVFLGSGKSGGY